MPAELTCPKCRVTLKAPPAGMAGRPVRCKRCKATFQIPGAPPPDEPGEPHPLSGIFEDPGSAGPADPAAQPVDRPTPLPATAGTAEALALLSGESDTGDTPPPRPARRSAGGSGRILVLMALTGLVCAAGGAAGVYFWARSRPGPAAGPADDKPSAAGPAPDGHPADGGPAAGEHRPPSSPVPAAGGDDRPTAKKPVTVTGGLKLPAFPAGPGTVFVAAKYKLPVEVAPAKARRVLLSGGDAGIAAVVWRSFEGYKAAGATDTVDRYSLKSGRRVDRQELPADAGPGPRLADLSPEGGRLAVESPAGRLTVWDLDAKAKLIDGLDPYADAGPAARPGIAAVYFLAEEKVAVVSRRGAVDVWDVGSKTQSVAGVPPGRGKPADPPADRRSVAITPDRRAVLVYAGGVVSAVSTQTGKPVASLALPRAPDAGYALAADASGARVVAAYRATDPGPHTVVLMARFGDERPSLLVHLDPAAGMPVVAAWTGQETAVVVTDKGVGLVLDGEVNRVVAAVKPAAGPAVHEPGAMAATDWCLLPDPADGKKSVLVGVPLPFDSYFGLREAAGAAPVGLVIGPEGLGR